MIENKSFMDIGDRLSKISLENCQDDDLAEYIVRVSWIKKVPLKEAVSEVGFFGNQNTVAKPTAVKWVHTIERLKKIWNIDSDKT